MTSLKPGKAIVLLLILAVAPLLCFGQSPDAIVGQWITTHGKARIKIYQNPKTHQYEGKIVWLKNPKDENGNPVKDANGNIVMGLKILQNLGYDDGEWTDGTIYDAESTKTYYCTLNLEGENTLEVRGSLDKMGWLGRTETWTRYQP